VKKFLQKIDGLLITKSIIILFFVVFLIIPLFSIFMVSFTDAPLNFFCSLINVDTFQSTIDDIKNSTLENYEDIVSRSGYLNSLKNSLILSISVSIVILILCLPVAYGIARTKMPFKKIISALWIIPLVMPTFIASEAITLMFGKTGWVTIIYNQLGGDGFLFNPYSLLVVAVVQVFFFFPYALWPMVAAFKISDVSLEEGAKNLGAKNWVTLLFITLPLAIPGILSSILLVFTVSFSDFGSPIILASEEQSLLIVDAYREMTGFFNWGGSAILSLVMVLVASVFLWLQRIITKKMDYGVISGKPKNSQMNKNKFVTTILSIFSIIIILIPALGALSILVQSFATTWGNTLLPSGFTFDNYTNIISSSSENMINSLLLATGALVLSIIIVIPLAYFIVRQNSGTLDFISSMPLVVPGIAIGIALIVTFNAPPLQLTGTALILIIAFTIRRLPYMVRSTVGTMQSIRSDIEEASINLGASRLTTIITVVGPLLLPGIAAGSLLVFVTVIKETSISVLMAPANWAPMTLSIFEFLLRGEHYPAASMAVIMIVIVLVLRIIADKLTKGESDS